MGRILDYFNNRFNYTDFHELNLDWVIKITSNMKANVDYLMEEFSKIKILTAEEIQAMIDATCAEVIKYSDLKNAELKADLESQLAAQYSLITNEYKAYTNNKISELKISLLNFTENILKMKSFHPPTTPKL